MRTADEVLGVPAKSVVPGTSIEVVHQDAVSLAPITIRLARMPVRVGDIDAARPHHTSFACGVTHAYPYEVASS